MGPDEGRRRTPGLAQNPKARKFAPSFSFPFASPPLLFAFLLGPFFAILTRLISLLPQRQLWLVMAKHLHYNAFLITGRHGRASSDRFRGFGGAKSSKARCGPRAAGASPAGSR
jgi:hypothetical protein